MRASLLLLITFNALAGESPVDFKDSDAKLTQSTLSLSQLAPSDLDKIKSAADELLPQARTLAEAYRKDFSASVPELAAWLKDRNEPPLTEFKEAPIVLLGSATEEDVLARWREQLKANLLALGGIAGNDGAFKEWLYWDDMAGARRTGRPYFRA